MSRRPRGGSPCGSGRAPTSSSSSRRISCHWPASKRAESNPRTSRWTSARSPGRSSTRRVPRLPRGGGGGGWAPPGPFRAAAGPLAPLLLVALHVLVVGLWSGRRRVRRRVPQTLVDDGGQRRGIELRESQGARGLEGAHRPSARPDLLQRRPRRRPPGRAEGPFELRGKKAAKEWNDAGGEDVGLQRPAACVVVREDAVQRALQEAAVERTLRLGRLYAIAALDLEQHHRRGTPDREQTAGGLGVDDVVERLSPQLRARAHP